MEIKHIGLESYKYPVFKDLEVVERNVVKIAQHLKLLYPYFQYELITRGTSGLTIATALARHLKPCVVYSIKKKGEQRHASNGLYNLEDADKYSIVIVIDDFISIGSTMNAIHDSMKMSCTTHLSVKVLCVQSLGTMTDDIHKLFPNLEYILTT